MDLFAWLEASAPARHLAESEWLYPLINAGHIIGIALLFGSVAALDLKMLGLLGRRVSVQQAESLLRPLAFAGFVMAVLAGFSLFCVQASSYALSTVFRTKMLLLALAILNALVYFNSSSIRIRKPVAGTSLLLWLGVIVSGRLIGYR